MSCISHSLLITQIRTLQVITPNINYNYLIKAMKTCPLPAAIYAKGISMLQYVQNYRVRCSHVKCVSTQGDENYL